jgi:hypothetical protein
MTVKYLRDSWMLVTLASAVVACGGSSAGASRSSGSSGGTSGAAAGRVLGSTGGSNPKSGGSPGVGGAGGVARAGAGGSGNAAAGGAGNAGGSGGIRPVTGGAAGSNSEADSGLPNVCPGATPAPPGLPTCHDFSECPFGLCSYEPAGGCPVNPHECSIDGDCSNGGVCIHGVCGDQCIPPCTSATCTADQVCAMSGHCEPKPCTAGYTCETGTLCAPTRSGVDGHGCAAASCSSDGYKCAPGFRCAPSPSADAHECSDISCTEGFACPMNFDCNPASTAAHHCDRRSCTGDSNCDCGACVEGVCQDRLFVCWSPPVCASPDTPIATQTGDTAIASLDVGDRVYSVDHDRVVLVPLVRPRRPPR